MLWADPSVSRTRSVTPKRTPTPQVTRSAMYGANPRTSTGAAAIGAWRHPNADATVAGRREPCGGRAGRQRSRRSREQVDRVSESSAAAGEGALETVGEQSRLGEIGPDPTDHLPSEIAQGVLAELLGDNHR